MSILGKSSTKLISDLNKKEINVNELRKYFKERIKKHDKKLNSYITINDKNEYKTDGILRGLPIAIKDNFCTKNLRTTASSDVLNDFIPPYDATVVTKLKLAGADVLGKTNMDAWAHGSSTETSDFGATSNPYDLSRVPGGSSGGSTAAVSAYLAPVSIGSDTGGSVRNPASWCGCVGLKPTYGRVSRYGLIAMGSSFDCPSIAAGCVEDAALVLKVISGHDKYDATSSQEEVPNYTKKLKTDKRFVVGIPEEYFDGVDEEIINNINQTIKVAEKIGYKVKKISLLPPKYAISVYTILQRSEVSSNLARYDGIRYGKNRRHFGQEAERRIMLGAYTLSHGYYDAYYKKALRVRKKIEKNFEDAFEKVDVIVAPTTPKTALKKGEYKKYPFFGELMDVLSEPASSAGIPSISIPSGFDSNSLPIGMQIMAPHFKEARLLQFAHRMEKEIGFDRNKILKKWKD